MTYDVLIIGGGPGGIYTAWELLNKRPDLKLALFESGHTLERRRCPIDGVKVKSCVHCPTCAIMNGFGGAGAFSDGKYNITNQFGGTLHEHIGKKKALELMEYVDQINMENGGEGTKLYSTGNTRIKKLCLENDLHLLDAPCGIWNGHQLCGAGAPLCRSEGPDGYFLRYPRPLRGEAGGRLRRHHRQGAL